MWSHLDVVFIVCDFKISPLLLLKFYYVSTVLRRFISKCLRSCLVGTAMQSVSRLIG